MNYEINVAKNRGTEKNPSYVHHFATSSRSITMLNRCKEIHAELKTLYPSPAFKITVTQNSIIGERINTKDW